MSEKVDYNQAKQTVDKKDSKEVPHKTLRDVILAERLAHPVVAVEAHLPSNADEPIPDVPVLEPLKLTEEQKKLAKEKADLLKQIGEILKQYDDRESSIPANSEYWGLVNKYRSL